MNSEELNKRQEPDAELTSDTGEPLTTADMAAAAKRQPIRGESIDKRELEIPNFRDVAARTGPNREPEQEEGFAPLFEDDALTELRARWSAVQSGFVDSPRRAVEKADELVAALMKRLAEVFAAERANLEAEWTEGENVSTEELRVALRRYRSFFDRLLSV